KAEPGQNTIIDSWYPAAEAAKSGASWPDIVAAAQAGADGTAQMQATLGRAARLGARSLGHKDPGAVSACVIIEECAKILG
ncbi:MAG: DAK2 domain-containing protein, partial [Cypionkella sp.]|nr:DAK2 domain-containing protein [Cypionkella sp.]